MIQKTLHYALWALGAAMLAGCGGSGGAAASQPALDSVPQESQVVVRYDLNGDSNPDLLTLDTTKTPFRIMEALDGTAGGGAVDTTALRRGQAIDPAVSDALADYLAQSTAAGSETRLDVTDENGNPFTLTIFE